MKQRHIMTKGPQLIGLTLLVAALLASVAPASAAKPPIGSTYFVVSLGVATDSAEAYQLDVGCLRFTPSEMCDTDNDCGSWWRISEKGLRKQWTIGFTFDLIDDETGLPVKVEGRGRIDARGPRSSIAGVAKAVDETSGVAINFAIAGRAVGSARCQQLVADFEEAQP